MKIIFIGDVNGRPGRRAVADHLPDLKKAYGVDFVIANGENAAGGVGISKDTALPLFAAGVDVITLGNHVWAQRGVEEFLNEDPRVIRPANLPSGLAGRGAGVFNAVIDNNPDKVVKVGVINLLGRVFMEPVDDPFKTADKLIEEMKDQAKIIIVDMHAEATSEKGAIAWYLDGRVSAVLGTHTHVPTCDERVLPRGTAFITDVGMVGARDSILGMKVDAVVNKFLTMMKQKHEVGSGPAVLSGVVLEIDSETGRAISIDRISVIEE